MRGKCCWETLVMALADISGAVARLARGFWSQERIRSGFMVCYLVVSFCVRECGRCGTHLPLGYCLKYSQLAGDLMKFQGVIIPRKRPGVLEAGVVDKSQSDGHGKRDPAEARG
jgi:hypothetical protein